MNTKEIIKMIQQGVKFENNNTQFFITKDFDFYMCEFYKDCKYTRFATVEQFAKRILKFYKTGY